MQRVEVDVTKNDVEPTRLSAWLRDAEERSDSNLLSPYYFHFLHQLEGKLVYSTRQVGLLDLYSTRQDNPGIGMIVQATEGEYCIVSLDSGNRRLNPLGGRKFIDYLLDYNYDFWYGVVTLRATLGR